MRRISNPSVKVWLPCVLVTLSTKSMLASARTQGKLAEYPTSGVGKSANIDTHQAAVELADIDARDSQVRGIVRSIVALLRRVVVVRHAKAEFVQQGGRENVGPS